MFKRLSVLLLSLVALVALGGCLDNNDKKDSGLAIAVVDQERAYRESKVAKLAVDHLEALSQVLQVELLALQEEAQKMEDQEKSQEFFEEGLAEMQQRFAAEQQMVTIKVTELFEATVDECRKKAEANVVLSADLVLAMDDMSDLTDDVIRIMDEKEVSFDEKEKTELSKDATEEVGASEAEAASVKGEANLPEDKVNNASEALKTEEKAVDSKDQTSEKDAETDIGTDADKKDQKSDSDKK